MQIAAQSSIPFFPNSLFELLGDWVVESLVKESNRRWVVESLGHCDISFQFSVLVTRHSSLVAKDSVSGLITSP